MTLELSNVSGSPITLYAGMRVSQISFMELSTPAEKPYGSGALDSKYQDQGEPVPSQYFRNYRAGRDFRGG